jgi:hypothetical protein
MGQGEKKSLDQGKNEFLGRNLKRSHMPKGQLSLPRRVASGARAKRKQEAILKRLGGWDKYLEFLSERLTKTLCHKEYSARYNEWIQHTVRDFGLSLGQVVYEMEFAYVNVQSVEWVYNSVQRLIRAHGMAHFEVASKNTMQAIEQVIRTMSGIGKHNRQELLKRLAMFHQVPDLKRGDLFEKATHQYFKRMQSSKTKRGYTWKKALEDVNEGMGIIPKSEFDNKYIELVNHYKTWRSRNRDLVERIKEGYTV